jgi:hypothetical protein
MRLISVVLDHCRRSIEHGVDDNHLSFSMRSELSSILTERALSQLLLVAQQAGYVKRFGWKIGQDGVERKATRYMLYVICYLVGLI